MLVVGMDLSSSRYRLWYVWHDKRNLASQNCNAGCRQDIFSAVFDHPWNALLRPHPQDSNCVREELLDVNLTSRYFL